MITPSLCLPLCLFPPLDWEPPEGRSEPCSSLHIVPGTQQVLSKCWQVAEQGKYFVHCKARSVERKEAKISLDGREAEHIIQSVCP